MPLEKYFPLSGRHSEERSSEEDGFISGARVNQNQRASGQKLLKLILGFVMLTSLLSAINLFKPLRSKTGLADPGAESKILNYFLTSKDGYRAAPLVERIYWDYDDDFLNDNLTIAHDAWANLFPPGEGIIALDDHEIEEIQAPLSNRAVLEPSKSIYLPGVFHQLHCLSVLRAQTIKIWQDPAYSIQDARYHHTMHCVDILRQALLCASDSNLIFFRDDLKWPGEGGKLTCRNFEALKEWTLARYYIPQSLDGVEMP